MFYDVRDKDENKRNIIVIGGGPGGYVSAIRAAQLGANVKLVEEKHIGGACLNVGCIPTKALLHSVELYNKFNGSEAYGIKAEGGISIDWNTMQSRKQEVVRNFVGGLRDY